MPKRYCLATITSEKFCTGTEVLLYSFLKYNPWFDGDIAIFADALPDEQRRRLSARYPVHWKARGPVVEEKISRLREQVPGLRADLHLRLLSLEVFLLAGYDKVVFLDSDGLCTSDLEAMFRLESPFAAVRDGFSYEDLADRVLKRAGKALIGGQPRYGREGKGWKIRSTQGPWPYPASCFPSKPTCPLPD